MSEVTLLLESLGKGDGHAAERLFPIVYEELRRLAGAQMAHQPKDHTLQATALVHEAYLRLVGANEPSWANRAHFFRTAAEAMRQILIEHARKRSSLKRGGGLLKRVDLQDLNLATEAADDTLLMVHDALDRFGAHDPAKAELVKLRFFIGLNIEECARVLQISEATVKRHWEFARAWLLREMQRLQEVV